MLDDGSLFISNVSEVSSAPYICVNEENDTVIYSVHLVVGGKIYIILLMYHYTHMIIKATHKNLN